MTLPYLSIALLCIATAYAAIVSFRKTEGRAPSWIFPQASSRHLRVAAFAFSFTLLIGLGWWLAMGARNSTRRPSRFLVPQGYTGWVRVEFEVPGAPPLPIEAGQYVLRIPADGILRTSSPEQYGWAKDHYYYDSAQGMRPLADSGPDEFIWGRVNGEASGIAGKRKYEEFYVGTEPQFKQQLKDKE